ncbi:MAG: YeiH family protein [Mobilitalea sp.]
MKDNKSSLIYGITAAILIAIPSYFLGQQFKLIGGSVFSILLGMLIASIKLPHVLEKGIKFTSKKILQYSIILIGFGMNMRAIFIIGKQSILVMLCTITASLLTAYFIGKLLKLSDNLQILIGVGTSICGGSAIAATAPVIEADDQDIALSISTIFLFNIIAVFLFPPIGRALGLSDLGFGMWAGTAINDTSSVVAAGYTFSDVAGDYATIVKLTRTLMIIPITLFLALYRTKKGKASSVKVHYSILKIFPWFVIGFLVTAIINSFQILPASIPSFLNSLGKFGIITAMAAIGLNTNLKKLITNGMKPISLGLCCWFVVAVVSLIVQNLIGII